MRALLEMMRPKISLFSGVSAGLGYMLSDGSSGNGLIVLFSATFLLASGASALNQVQERRTDALMERTKGRPLPTGRTSPLEGAVFSAVLILAGLGLLTLGSWTSAVLGLIALAFYNLLYTPLKRLTPFCLLAGSVAGALPPLMGYAFAGGVLDPRAVFLFFFFYLWQVPHFILILMRREEDYIRAGMPVLSGGLGRGQIARIAASWMLSSGCAALMLALSAG